MKKSVKFLLLTEVLSILVLIFAPHLFDMSYSKEKTNILNIKKNKNIKINNDISNSESKIDDSNNKSSSIENNIEKSINEELKKSNSTQEEKIDKNSTWEYNLNTKTLTIISNSAMNDYSSNKLPEWNKYKNDIKKIVIEENVTKLGKYSFYGLTNVQDIYINSNKLDNMELNNYTFYNVGSNTSGVNLTLGKKVTNIPSNLTYPKENETLNIKTIKFEENSITNIGKRGLSHINIDYLILPESIKTIDSYAFENNNNMKVILIPSLVTKLPDGMVKGSKTLETVIFGRDTTSIGHETLYDCPKLEKLVIPNKNFNIGSETIVNKYASIGLDIWGPSQFDSYVETLNQELSTKKFYYFSINKYRPIVYGDKENYTVEFDELFFNTSTNVTIKTIINADTIFKGAKYRYKDSNGKIYIIDGLEYTNTTLKNVKMDAYVEADIINRDNCQTPVQTVLFIGNSLTTGFTYGMAASDDKSDYVYYVMKYINSFNSNNESLRYVANPFENATSSEERNKIVEKMITNFENKRNKSKPVKTIFLEFGTNVTKDEEKATFVTDTTYMINRLRETYPNAKIYWTEGLIHPNTLKLVQESASKNNIPVIDASYIRNTARYTSYIGAKYLKDNKIERITSGGVAAHPGDYGFTCMGNSIITKLKKDNYCLNINR